MGPRRRLQSAPHRALISRSVQPAGIWPVIVLTKLDCAAGGAGARGNAARADSAGRSRSVAVDATSATSRAGARALSDAGRTIVLLGFVRRRKVDADEHARRRGACKRRAAVRADDARWPPYIDRPASALPRSETAKPCVIDTPGLRGLRPDIDADDLGASFPRHRRRFGQRCRFSRLHSSGRARLRQCAAGCRCGSACQLFTSLQREIRRDHHGTRWHASNGSRQRRLRARALRAAC